MENLIEKFALENGILTKEQITAFRPDPRLFEAGTVKVGWDEASQSVFAETMRPIIGMEVE